MNFNWLIKPAVKVGEAVGRHLPEIMVGSAIVGVGFTVGYSIKLGPEMKKIFEEDKEQDKEVVEFAKDMIKVSWPLVIAVLGTSACILGVHAFHIHRELLLAAANKDLAQKYLEYKTAAMATLGTGELAVAGGVANSHITREDIPDEIWNGCEEVDMDEFHRRHQEEFEKRACPIGEINTDDQEVLVVAHDMDPMESEKPVIFYDEYSEHPFVSNWRSIMQAEESFIDLVETNGGIACMNDWLRRIGLSATAQGAIDVISIDDAYENECPFIRFEHGDAEVYIDGKIVPIVIVRLCCICHELNTDDLENYGAFIPEVDQSRIRCIS